MNNTFGMEMGTVYCCLRKKGAPKCPFFRRGSPSANGVPEREPLIVALVVLQPADLPEVRVHGLLAVGKVLLCEEVDLVLGDLGQVFLTCRYHRTDSLETLTDSSLLRFERRGTLGLTADIYAITVTAGCRCYTVRAQQHLAARVLTALARFAQCAGNTVYTGTPYYFCHKFKEFNLSLNK